MDEMTARAAAAQATLDKFKDKPFEIGKYDCAKMAAFHCRKMGRAIKGGSGKYDTLLGMAREMKRRKCKRLADVFDKQGWLRITPASALIGDLIELEGAGAGAEFGTVCIAVGNGRVLGYHEDAEGAVVMQPSEYVAAWRVPCG